VSEASVAPASSAVGVAVEDRRCASAPRASATVSRLSPIHNMKTKVLEPVIFSASQVRSKTPANPGWTLRHSVAVFADNDIGQTTGEIRRHGYSRTARRSLARAGSPWSYNQRFRPGKSSTKSGSSSSSEHRQGRVAPVSGFLRSSGPRVLPAGSRARRYPLHPPRLGAGNSTPLQTTASWHSRAFDGRSC